MKLFNIYDCVRLDISTLFIFKMNFLLIQLVRNKVGFRILNGKQNEKGKKI